MNAIVQKDKRSDLDKRYDKMWNKLCDSAKLTARQSTLVSYYLRELLTLRIHEVESARDMSWLLSLIEGEKYGTDVKRGATKLLRVQELAADICNEAYSKECVNANGRIEYDGCGIEHLQTRLRSHGVEYDMQL
jgi:hypothetical protein